MKMRLVLQFASIIILTLVEGRAGGANIQSFEITLPSHSILFSLPREITKLMRQDQVERRFDPSDPIFIRKGFRDIARTYFQFNRPILGDEFGGILIELTIVKRISGFEGEINTANGLESYLVWWMAKKEPLYGFKYERRTILGALWLERSKKTLGLPHSSSDSGIVDVEALCAPLNNDMFFQASFCISESLPGNRSKWEKHANELRDAIEATLEVRSTALPGQM
jgi:hypothetical protein